MNHILPPADQVSMQEGRLVDLQRSIQVLDHGGPPLLGVVPPGSAKIRLIPPAGTMILDPQRGTRARRSAVRCGDPGTTRACTSTSRSWLTSLERRTLASSCETCIWHWRSSPHSCTHCCFMKYSDHYWRRALPQSPCCTFLGRDHPRRCLLGACARPTDRSAIAVLPQEAVARPRCGWFRAGLLLG